MNQISKLVIREIVPPMLVSLVIFLFVFLMRTIAQLAKMLIENQYTLAEIGLLLLYSIPSILGFVIPMSLLLGIILGLNRLSSDSEIIAITSCGISSHSLLFPTIAVAIVAWLANMWLLTAAVPWANQEYRNIIMLHTSEVINSEVTPRVFNENFPGYIIFVNEIDVETGEWDEVFIFDKNDPDNPRAILSRRARLIEADTTGSIDLQITDYYSYTFPRDSLSDPTQVTRGSSTVFHIVEGQNLEERVSGAKDDRSKTVSELLEDVEANENVMLYRFIARNRGLRPQTIQVEILPEDLEPVRKSVEILSNPRNDQTYEVNLRLPDGYENKPFKMKLLRGDEVLIDKAVRIDEFVERRGSYPVEQETTITGNFSLINSQLVRMKTNSQWIEIHKKFALPFTCLIFAFLGMPLGLSSRRGGKAYGYIVGISIFVIYWGLLSTGERLATYERISPALGVWLPNMFFGVLAVILIIRNRLEIRLPGLSSFLLRVRSHEDFVTETVFGEEEALDTGGNRAQKREFRGIKIRGGRSLPTVLDKYVIKTFITMFLLVFLAMYTIFSLVQYIDRSNDIQKNDVDPAIILDFFKYQAPETIYWIIPISTLMGTMICFGILSKNQEVVAFKSCGISIYRLSIPVVVMAIIIAMLGFFNQDIVIPQTSDDLARVKSTISRGPVQTIRDPGNRWILAENKRKIYFFHQFDSEQEVINELHIYDIDPQTRLLARKIYAHQAAWQDGNWTADRGWLLEYDGVTSTQRILRTNQQLPIQESPLYFGQEFRPADQMSFAELEEHIATLRQYGLSTTKEEFELNWKLAFPFLPIVMTILGLPFSFSNVRKGSGALTGIFISIFAVIIYWGIMTLFKALGETGYLPALLAAWSPNIVFLGIGVLLFFSVRS